MAKLGKITVLATAAEAARQWAKNNPDKAQAYIDKAGAVVDRQTKGKYSTKITKASTKAKEAVAKGSSGGGSSVPPPAPQGGSVGGSAAPPPPPPAG